MRIPLAVRILVGVVLGCIAAWIFGTRMQWAGDAGMLVVRLLKALAGPLVFVAVLDAFLRSEIPARKGAQLLAISSINACVAIAIGLGVAHAVHRTSMGTGHLGELFAQLSAHPSATRARPDATLDPMTNVSQWFPESIVEPFLRNQIISLVLLAVAVGLALRTVRGRGHLGPQIAHVTELVEVALAALTQMLAWVVAIVPFAVFGIVASVVSRTGVHVFALLAPFLVTVLLGLALQGIGWYSLLIGVFGRRSPLRFFRDGADAIVTALSCGSSLATLPVTLRCLDERHHVSPASARLAACVGTNLDHDGIILYEAAAALFVAHALGIHPSFGQQVVIALSAVMAGIGIAGVPEAGLITLPLVLGAARLPEPIVAAVIPLLLPVDWLVGRCRAAVNVTSDMVVAVLLDRDRPRSDAPQRAA